MKAILMSIKPQHVANILNEIKTLEIRKKFPKDYVGWVYIYCTKENDLFKSYIRMGYYTTRSTADDLEYNGKGKVVARFWCDKVEEHRPFFHWCKELEKATCLTRDDVLDYLDSKDKFVGNPKRQGKVYAIHITEVKPFDKPKEISEFKYYKKFSKIDYMLPIPRKETCERLVALTRAPQSWCYVEI